MLFQVNENERTQQQILVEDRSILDAVFTQAKSMEKRLNATDRAKMDEYLTSVREVEQTVKRRAYWADRDPAEVKRADEDPKHRMALCFRWYLGMSSRWAIQGQEDRRPDYQIWCGPAMGAFNDWAQGTFLEAPENRQAVQIALNLLEGAAAITRAHQLRSYGVAMPAAAFEFPPRPLALG